MCCKINKLATKFFNKFINYFILTNIKIFDKYFKVIYLRASSL